MNSCVQVIGHVIDEVDVTRESMFYCQTSPFLLSVLQESNFSNNLNYFHISHSAFQVSAASCH